MKQIVRMQSKGPYYIGGFSFGGLVAYEIAQRLKRSGRAVERLMLVDTYPPDSIKAFADFKRTDHPESVHKTSPQKIKKRIKRKIINIKTRSFIGEPNKPLDFLCKFMIKLNIPIPGKQLRNHYILRTWRTARINYQIEKYNGNMTYFKASEPAKAHEQNEQLWQSVVLGKFNLFVIPGKHLDLIKEPSVRILSDKINNLMVCSE